MAGAHISATQTDTGLIRTADSGADGVYQLPSLPVGPYKLEVQKDGFNTYNQSGIVLQVGSSPTIEVTLQVGAVNQTVNVEAAAAMVETSSSGVGQVVDQQRVVDLPLNGRQPTQLITLSGAAVIVPTANSGQLISQKNYPNEVSISVAGGPANGLTYSLDGGTHNDPVNNAGLPLPFPDALQEFKIETSALQAQYGQHSGGAVNAVTKSGGNAFHGDAFEFVRNRDIQRARYLCTNQRHAAPESVRRHLWRPHQEKQAVFLPRLSADHSEIRRFERLHVRARCADAGWRFHRLHQWRETESHLLHRQHDRPRRRSAPWLSRC